MNALIQRFSVITGFSLLILLLLFNAALTRQRIADTLVENQSFGSHTLNMSAIFSLRLNC